MLYEGDEEISSTLAWPFETVDIVEETSRQLSIHGKGETLVTFQCFALTESYFCEFKFVLCVLS